MARSPFTLAASVTSALPRVGVVGVGPLTESATGRFDSAVVTLDDDRRVVVRVPVDADADTELTAEARALRALTPGVRGLLPFDAPHLLGETRVDGMNAIVQDLLPGYRVDAAHIPQGPGLAVSIGAAIASVHDLPVSVVRDAGLPVRSSTAVRDDIERLLDRAEATGLLPFGLLRRWSTALGAERLWRFEATVVLGGVEPSSFIIEESDEGPRVSSLLAWHGLSVGDPAEDLRWLASATAAREDVLDAYAAASHRSPDALLRERARLYAELEFAKWLVHGHTAGSESVVADAVELLESLDANVRDEPLIPHDASGVDDALALIGRFAESTDDSVDTSMQTDTYDAAAVAAFIAESDAERSPDEFETAPVELSGWTTSPAAESAVPEQDDADEDDEQGAAARNAMRRWTGSN